MSHQQALAAAEILSTIGQLEECLEAARETEEGIAQSDPTRIRGGLDRLARHTGYKGKLIVGAGRLASGATDDTALFLDDLTGPDAERERIADQAFDSARDEGL